jgi:iron complex outermembrane receptor protein
MPKITMLRCTVIALAWAMSFAAGAYADTPGQVSVPMDDLSTLLESFVKTEDVEFIYQTGQFKGMQTRGAVVGAPSHDSANPVLGAQATLDAPVASAALRRPRQWYTADVGSETNFEHQFRLVQVDNTAAAQGERAGGQKAKTQEGAGLKLEEIIVTAQRRTEKLQDIPVSAQVIGGQILAEQNQKSLEDLTRTVPAVHISSGHNGNNLFIRGIGSSENPSFDQSVAIFVDDIYHGRSRMSNATFLDLDRIEVLKGPQSTFFGNNAIAGALSIVTKKPGKTFDASVRALYGQFGQYALEGAIGGPITDTFGARLAVTRNGVDRGWIDNVNTGQHVPRINNLAGRVTLVFDPTEYLDATLKIEGSKHRTSGTFLDGGPYQWTKCPPPAPFTIDFGNFGNLGYGCPQALALGVPIGLRQNKVSQIAGQYDSLSTFEDVLTINYRHWGHTFTSTSGFFNYHFNQNNDQGGLPIAVVANQQPEKYHQFSQEFRVASPTDQPIQYLVGGYFQTDRVVSIAEVNLPVLNFLGVAFPETVPYLPLAQVAGLSQSEHVYSVFGSLSWNATDRLKLNAGLRESWVGKDSSGPVIHGTGTQTYGGFVPLPPTAPLIIEAILGGSGQGPTLSRSDQALMPSAGIQYQLNPQAMVYFSYSKGFKAGGINGQLGTFNAPTTLGYAPEHVNAYELGLKSKWFDDRVLLNLDVFRSNYKDLQVNAVVLSPTTGFQVQEVTNAAASRSQGVELETQWAVSRGLRLSANVTYLDSYYVSFPNAPAASLQVFCQLNSAAAACAQFPPPVPAFASISGQPTQFSPKWSGSVIASYSMLFPGEYKFTTELSPYFTSGYYLAYSQGADPFFRTDSYVRLDARLTLETPDGRWDVDLIGKNLTDREIVTANYSQGINLQQKEQPRNVAVQVRYHF